MLSKDEEIGLYEIVKNHFPNLEGKGLVISHNEFLTNYDNLKNYICTSRTVQDTVGDYIKENIPYIVLDESEGFKCLFFKGNFLKVQFDATNNKLIDYHEIDDGSLLQTK